MRSKYILSIFRHFLLQPRASFILLFASPICVPLSCIFNLRPLFLCSAFDFLRSFHVLCYLLSSSVSSTIMPSLRQLNNFIRYYAIVSFSLLPTDIRLTATNYALTTFRKTKYFSHRRFITTCNRLHLIPRGFASNFRPSAGNIYPREQRMLQRVDTKCASRRMHIVATNYSRLISELDSSKSELFNRLQYLTSDNFLLFSLIRLIIHTLNRQLYDFMCTQHNHKLNCWTSAPFTPPYRTQRVSRL